MSGVGLEHGCKEFDEDRDGWWCIECDCGWSASQFAEPATAVDELIDHVISRTLDWKPQ